jgi:hypothetical protein
MHDPSVLFSLRLWNLLGSSGVLDIYCDMLCNLGIKSSLIIRFEDVPVAKRPLVYNNYPRICGSYKSLTAMPCPREIDNQRTISHPSPTPLQPLLNIGRRPRMLSICTFQYLKQSLLVSQLGEHITTYSDGHASCVHRRRGTAI